MRKFLKQIYLNIDSQQLDIKTNLLWLNQIQDFNDDNINTQILVVEIITLSLRNKDGKPNADQQEFCIQNLFPDLFYQSSGV